MTIFDRSVTYQKGYSTENNKWNWCFEEEV